MLLNASAHSWAKDTWPISTPQKEGIDTEAIDALLGDMQAGKYGLLDHFLLIRHGRVVADRHFEYDYMKITAKYDRKNHQYNYDHPAWHPYYRDTNLHTLQSMTKSIASVVLGIAIDEGHIPEGVEALGMSFFEAYERDLSDSRRRSITLEHMLTMRSGIQWNEMSSYDNEQNSGHRLEASDNWIQFVLDQPMREQPGTVFDYNSGVSVLLGKIVGVVTGWRIDAYAEKKLFEPLGIKDYYWKTTPDGEVDTEGGLYLSAHDLARIGLLFLRNGKWDGEQIVSEAWVQASTAPVVANTRPDNGPSQAAYGYQWWIPRHEDGKTKIFTGVGFGGQLLLVAPEYDLVAIFNAWNVHGTPELNSQSAIVKRILPATSK